MSEERNIDCELPAGEEAVDTAEAGAERDALGQAAASAAPAAPASQPAPATASEQPVAPAQPAASAQPAAPQQAPYGAQVPPQAFGQALPPRPSAYPPYGAQQTAPGQVRVPSTGYQPYPSASGFYQPQPPAPAPVAVPVAAPAQSAAAAAAPKKQRSWGKIIAWVLVTVLLVFSAFSMGSCAGMFSRTMDASLDPNGYALSSLDQDAIAVITLAGDIGYDGSSCSPEGFKLLLDKAEKNDHIKAVLLRVNSGGGSATAGEEMAAYLKDFSKPVVVSSASMNASAAYEISSQADYIYVNKSTEIGSIGTIIQFTDYSDLLDKLGIKSDNIASADSKDSSYGTRELTEEEREYYQQLVDQINQVFIENVAEGRNMSVEDVKKLATGLVFSGSDAVENGIADEIGTREDAAKKAAELGGIKTDDFKEVSLTLGSSSSITSILDLLGSSASDPMETSEILEDGYNGGNAE